MDLNSRRYSVWSIPPPCNNRSNFQVNSDRKIALVKRFLTSTNLEHVRQGLEFLDVLASEDSQLMTELIGEVSVDNNGQIRCWGQKEERDVWRLAPPIKCLKTKGSVGRPFKPQISRSPHWLWHVKHQNYIALWTLAWQVKHGESWDIEFIDLKDSQLQELPDNIGNLQSLIQIRLNQNQLENLPRTFGDLKKLRVVDLEQNNFRKFPACLTKLQNLEELNLNKNKLRTLPEGIRGFSKLENLSLWRNQIATLPEELGKMRKLVHLGLEENRLNQLPESIGDLEHLTHLDLSHNPIGELPVTVIGLYRLKTIVISRTQKELRDQIYELLPEVHIGY